MTAALHAYCRRNGKIEFGPATPSDALEIMTGRDKLVRQEIAATARLAHDNTTLLVPGIPEAADDDAATEALLGYVLWLQRRGAQRRRRHREGLRRKRRQEQEALA